MMEIIDSKDWGEIGMVISFLESETWRSTN